MFFLGGSGGAFPKAVWYFYLVVYILYNGALHAALLVRHCPCLVFPPPSWLRQCLSLRSQLVAKGWLITRSQLEPAENRHLLGTVLAYCISLFLFAFFTFFRGNK